MLSRIIILIVNNYLNNVVMCGRNILANFITIGIIHV
jgi:hypothetical protein